MKKIKIFATEVVTHIFKIDEDKFDEEYKNICNDKLYPISSKPYGCNSFLTKAIDSKNYKRESYLSCVEPE